MKYLFIGLGSIGLRHLKNLRSLTDEPIYALRTKIDKVIDFQYHITSMTSLKDAMALKPDVVFITNPTSKHMSYALMFCDCHLFIEKPISINIADVAHLLAVLESNNKICFVGFNWRFDKKLMTLGNMVDSGAIGKIYFANFQFGQYLPSWHPNEDYKNSYSAKKDLGGGAVLTLCHDIDLAYWLFGPVKTVYAQTAKVSSLDIDVEDIATIILEMRSGATVTIQLDFLRPYKTHSVRVFGEKNDWGWWEEDEKDRDKTFELEMEHFLGCVKDGVKPIISHKDIIAVMRIIDAIKESSRTGRKVYL